MSFPFGQPKDGFGFTGGPTMYQTPPGYGIGDLTQKYTPGTIMHYENPTLNGVGAAMYGQYDESGVADALGNPVALSNTGAQPWEFTPDISDGVMGPCAIQMSLLTDDYFGWFWIYGCCPDFYVAASTKFDATTITTDGTLTAGNLFYASADDTLTLYAETVAALPMGKIYTDDGGTEVAMSAIHLLGNGF